MSGLLAHEAFLASAGRHPAKTAVRFEGREIGYRDLAQDMRRLSGALQDGLKLPAGSRVGVLMPNRPEYFTAVLAIAHAGLIAVPVPVRVTPRELRHFVTDSGMSLLLADDAAAQGTGDELDALSAAGLGVHTWDNSWRGAASVQDLMAAGSPSAGAAPVRDSDPFFFGYTSGTTGAPKGVVLSHRARTALTLLYGQEYGCYTASDTALVTTPLYHGAGLTRGLTPLMTGGSVILHRRFDPERAVATLAAPPVTAVFMVPTMYSAIFSLGESISGQLRERPVTILSNAAALPDALKAQILDSWHRVRLFEIYGSTEAGTVSSLRPEDQRRKSVCVGPPLALTDVELRDDDGNPVPAGQPGQLWSRSPFTFSRYYNNEKATAEAFRGDFVSVGDLARRDDEGYLYIVGRKGDVIISGGVNVYPREIEEILAFCPGVAEVAVIGVPDDYWGERVHAVVVPEPGRQLDAAGLEHHCRRLLSPQKVPRSVEIRASLPRTSSGKIAKYLIRPDGGNISGRG